MTRLAALLATTLIAGSAWAQVSPPAPAQGQAPAAAAPAPAAQAQGQVSAAQTQVQGLSGEGDCPAADAMAQPATQPQPGANGTDPNNTGTTGWTGGTGGSQIGTNTQGADRASPTWQPPTARGLDLKGRAEPVAARSPAC